MQNPAHDVTTFMTTVRTPGERRRARLLVDSLRSFGGDLSQCPIWLFEADPLEAPCGSLAETGVDVLPLEVPATVRGYLYAAKVAACAQAETLAQTNVGSLVYLAPENLIVKPPQQFDLGETFDVSVRPVHIRNVGLLTSDPVDGFWRGVYDVVGVHDVRTSVESFVDTQQLRAYFNSAAFAVNPGVGLFHRWFECFEALVNDRDYQSRYCQDVAHRVFLHQAVLSTVIVTELGWERVRILSPDYVYPYNLHQAVRPDRRVRALDDLVCVYYEDRPLAPALVDDLAIHEPLRTWLSAHPDVDAR